MLTLKRSIPIVLACIALVSVIILSNYNITSIADNALAQELTNTTETMTSNNATAETTDALILGDPI